MRDARTIIIAADPRTPEKKGGGWFGGGAGPEADAGTCVTASTLKRLLNAVMQGQLPHLLALSCLLLLLITAASPPTERNRVQGVVPKVVALARAVKPSKGLGSLLAGDTFSLESEVILQCASLSLTLDP